MHGKEHQENREFRLFWVCFSDPRHLCRGSGVLGCKPPQHMAPGSPGDRGQLRPRCRGGCGPDGRPPKPGSLQPVVCLRRVDHDPHALRHDRGHRVPCARDGGRLHHGHDHHRRRMEGDHRGTARYPLRRLER